jgi:hypothetical protein
MSKRAWYTALMPVLAVILLLPISGRAQGVGIGLYNAFDGGRGLTLGTGIGMGFGELLTVELNGHYIDPGWFTPDAEGATRPWVQTRVIRLELPLVARIPVGVYELYVLGGGTVFLPVGVQLLTGNIDRDLRDDLGHLMLNADLEGGLTAAWGSVLGARVTLPIPSARLQLGVKFYQAVSTLDLEGSYGFVSDKRLVSEDEYSGALPVRYNGIEVGLSVGL